MKAMAFLSTVVLGILVTTAVAALAEDASPPANRDTSGSHERVKVEPSVEAWVRVLAERIADPQDSIRQSAREALVAVGRPALPVLRKLAAGDNTAAASSASKLIARIQSASTADRQLAGTAKTEEGPEDSRTETAAEPQPAAGDQRRSDLRTRPFGGPFRRSRNDLSARSGLKVGDLLADVSGYDSQGREFHLRSLKEHYSVIVFGCLT